MNARLEAASVEGCWLTLASRVAARVGADGAMRDRCGSRLLESALMLALLRRENLHQEAQGALMRYLWTARPDGPFEAAVRSALLHRVDDTVRRAASAHTENFVHATGARKRLLFSTVLAVLGVVPHEPHPGPLDYGGSAAWTDLIQCGLKVLNVHGRGHPHKNTAMDRDYLLRALRSRGQERVWEGHVLAHLIALHALSSSPDADTAVLHAGISAVLREQNDDGGIPPITGLEFYLTAETGTALHAAGAPAAVLNRMGDFLERHQFADGGWGFTCLNTQSDVDDTARCAEFLHAVNSERYAAVLHRAELYLAAAARPEGGFPTYPTGDVGEVDPTASAVLALAANWWRHRPLLDGSVKFLLDAARPDGTFEPAWSLSESSVINRVAAAFGKCLDNDPSPDVAERIRLILGSCVRYLLANQNRDGGWGRRPGEPSSLLATAQAIPVLSRHEADPAVLRRALRYTLTQQQTCGRFVSAPDLAGPRPMAIEVPVLPDLHALAALTSVHAPARLS